MSMTDPIADLLTRIRNAVLAKHDSLEIPKSKVKLRITEILKEEGYIADFSLLDDRHEGLIHIDLRWVTPTTNAIQILKRESKPGRRVYLKKDELPKVRNGHGIAIMSTSHGVMTDASARRTGVGGEYLCSVY